MLLNYIWGLLTGFYIFTVFYSFNLAKTSGTLDYLPKWLISLFSIFWPLTWLVGFVLLITEKEKE